jgi:hypothetical protein
MSISEWVVDRLLGSTDVTAITSNVFPGAVPIDTNDTTFSYPAIAYIDNIGFTRNLTVRQPVLSIRAYENTRAKIQTLNDVIYDLFDTSTRYIKESSSNLEVHSVEIVGNVPALWDKDNDLWISTLDVLINHSIRKD